MAKAELGTKRLCPNCGVKYYDLNRDPITCPKCGASFATGLVAARPVLARKDDEEIEDKADDVDVISLEEADIDGEAKVTVSVDDDDIEDVDAEIEADDDAFLEDDDDAVAVVVDDEEEEER